MAVVVGWWMVTGADHEAPPSVVREKRRALAVIGTW